MCIVADDVMALRLAFGKVRTDMKSTALTLEPWSTYVSQIELWYDRIKLDLFVHRASLT